VALPVLVGSDVAAIVTVYATEPGVPDAGDLEGLGAVGVTLGRALEREGDREARQQLALIDELTGLCSRRGFVTLAEQALRVAAGRWGRASAPSRATRRASSGSAGGGGPGAQQRAARQALRRATSAERRTARGRLLGDPGAPRAVGL
jgi:hypothetical protein